MTIDATIEKIILENLSAIRFGDGEMTIINGYDIGYQQYNANLKNELVDIAKSKTKGIIICIPDIFHDLSNQNHNAQIFWKCHLQKYRKYWLLYFCSSTIYGNAFISRFYIDSNNKSDTKRLFDKVKKIWQDREVIVIEGSETRLGVGNDLLSNCRNIKRIICPSKNAFEKFNFIIESVKNNNRKKLILIALGPCAKPVAFSLHELGFQAIDIGHIDIEYEWFLAGAIKKVPVNRKYVNEVSTDESVEECSDIEYIEQIIHVIK